MAKGTKIDELFLSLGLDLSDLDADLALADKTVAQGIQQIKAKQTQTKLKMEIDMANFAGAEQSVEALMMKEQRLTEQIRLQKQAVSLVNATYLESVRAKGEEDAASQRILTRLLREQKAESDLAAQIREVNRARLGEGAATGTFGLSTVANKATAAVGELTTAAGNAQSKVLALNGSIASLLAVAATGAGLFDIVKGAVDAGENIYQLSHKLHLTTDEAIGLNNIFKMSNVDAEAFIPTIVRLDKAVQTAGKSGNDTTLALQAFGISLTDQSGKLLPINQQLAALASGYEQAAKNGDEEAYTAEILGTRGAALVPILKDYAINAEAASRIKTIGIDPEQAHELSKEFKILNAESSQLGNAFGNALLPIAEEVAPEIAGGMQDIIQAIRDNKTEIAGFTTDVIAMGAGAGEAITDLAGALKSALDYLGQFTGSSANAAKETAKLAAEIWGVSKAIKAVIGLGIPLPLPAKAAAVVGTAAAEILNYNAARKEQQKIDETIRLTGEAPSDTMAAVRKNPDTGELEKEVESMDFAGQRQVYWDKVQGEELENLKAKIEANQKAQANPAAVGQQQDNSNKINEMQAGDSLMALKKAQADAKATAAVQEELQDAIYHASHDRIENELYDIDKKAQKSIQAGVDEAVALELAEVKKSEIREKYREELASNVEQLNESMLRASDREFEATMMHIEEERKAWVKKAQDEVAATEWAEQEKMKAIKDAVRSQYGTEIRAVQDAIKQGRSMVEAYSAAHQAVLKEQQIDRQAYDFVRKNMLGIEMPGDIKSRMVVDMENRSAYNILEAVQKLQYNATVFQKPDAVNSPRNVRIDSINLSFPTQRADEVDIQKIADEAADVIAGKIKQHLDSDDNSY